MKRTKKIKKREMEIMARKLANNTVMADGAYSRANLAAMMGKSYGGKRNLHEALGYPNDSELTFEYYHGKYDRNAIASAIIDRPPNKTWTGKINLLETGATISESPLNKEWKKMNSTFGVKAILKKLDKLSNLGHFAVLLFGFDDVKKNADFSKPVGGNSVNLVYLKTYSEGTVEIDEWEKNASNERYGQPLFYKIKTSEPGSIGYSRTIQVHHTRILHVHTESLISSIYGRPALKPIINRIIDIEKLLGGDAEMFWRGARPGYTALSREDYDMGDPEIEALEEELDKYEHDLRRFITAQGVDIKTLEQQVADPLNHLDAQLQAISAQTGIPKRILIGSERGELSSAQDAGEWNSLIMTRQEEFAEPIVLRPFINRCMDLGILTEIEDYEYGVLWDDVFSPSEKDKVAIGKIRADALKIYSDSLMGSELIPFEIAAKMFLALSDEDIADIVNRTGEIDFQEDDEQEVVPLDLPATNNPSTQLRRTN